MAEFRHYIDFGSGYEEIFPLNENIDVLVKRNVDISRAVIRTEIDGSFTLVGGDFTKTKTLIDAGDYEAKYRLDQYKYSTTTWTQVYEARMLLRTQSMDENAYSVVSGDFTTIDSYTDIIRNLGDEFSIYALGLSYAQATYYLDSLAIRQFFANMGKYNAVLQSLIERNQGKGSVQVRYDPSYQGTNLPDLDFNKMLISETNRPLPISDGQTRVSIEILVNVIRDMFETYWFVGNVGNPYDNFQFAHISEIVTSGTYDLTTESAYLKNYKFITPKVPRVEHWKRKYDNDGLISIGQSDMLGYDIVYDISTEEKVDYDLEDFAFDAENIKDNPTKIDDSKLCMVYATLGGVNPTEWDIDNQACYHAATVRNGKFAMTHAHPTFWKDYRYLDSGEMNTVSPTAFTQRPTKRQIPIPFYYGELITDFPFNAQIQTSLGNGEAIVLRRNTLSGHYIIEVELSTSIAPAPPP
jgi:hypothetical protein